MPESKSNPSQTNHVLRGTVAVLVIGLIVLGISGWTCSATEDGGPPPATVAPTAAPSHSIVMVVNPITFDQTAVSPPGGFSSWQEYVSFVESLLQVRNLGELTEPGRITINPDGTLTIVPALVTLPDGSTGQLIGIVANGAPSSFNEDGTVSLDLREHEYWP